MKTVPCRSCRMPIYWLRSRNDKPVPVDAQPFMRPPTEGQLFDPRTMRAHFATCPHASAWKSGALPKGLEKAPPKTVEKRYGMELTNCPGCFTEAPTDELETCGACGSRLCGACLEEHDCAAGLEVPA